MRMAKQFKKLLSYVCAFALVLTMAANYKPETVNAAVTDWSALDYAGDGAGGGAYSNLYKFYCETSGVGLVNIQQPGFASEAGLYVTFPAGVSSVSVSSDIQGAGVILHLSAFTAKETEITVVDGLGTYTCYVYYENGTEGGSTIIVKPEINGFQMSTSTMTVGGSVYDGGVRTVYCVEPEIGGQTVTEAGLIYGVTSEITEDDMVIGSSSQYVASKAATSAGELAAKFGSSTTAKYYAMTMAEDLANASVTELDRTYSVRVYAKLADGTYVYSDVATFSKYSVGDFLYKNLLLTTYTAHNYIYTNVLSRVNSAYAKVDYEWGNTVAKPSDINK